MVQQIRIAVEGMHCGACTGRVERAAVAVAGVQSAEANLVSQSLTLAMDGPLAPVAQALAAAGYPVATAEGVIETSEPERALQLLQGAPALLEAQINGTHLTLRYAKGQARLRDFVARLTAAGLAAQAEPEPLPQSATERAAQETARAKRRFTLAAWLTAPVFALAMGPHLYPPLHHMIHSTLGPADAWLQMALTALVLAWPGRGFFVLGLPALARFAPEMNALVALGAGAAFALSALATLAPELLPPSARGVYFETSAVIVTLILLGRWLEARAKGQAGAAIAALAALAPAEAELLREGQVILTPIDDLNAGDILRIRPAARVPVDGVVVEGASYVDESMLTGEPIPVLKTSGSPLTGGTVNGSAELTLQVTKTGQDTVLARIIAMVERAQSAKLPVQDLVDRVTRVFVPAIMALAALTGLGHWALGFDAGASLTAAISVIVIACPCAMGLATPVSILVGTGRAAQAGVLFRQGDALQRLASAQIIAFDKTGTLTQGRPALTDRFGDLRALPLAAALESRSNHPLARAIVQAAEGMDLPPARRVSEIAGKGMRGQVGGTEVIVGNRKAMEGLDCTAFEHEAEALGKAAKTPVWVAQAGQVIALFGLADPLKPSAAEAIASLKAQGVTPVMISGDTEAAARACAATLGIDEVVAGVLPEGKVATIQALKTRGTVGFVGDGINDAPALAAADIGIALGTGTDVAIEAAQVVLMQGDPRLAARARSLSIATLRNIKQNLFWAFGYNAALVPVAMGLATPFGLTGISPMLAAGAMAFSSVFVVSNALRLRRA